MATTTNYGWDTPDDTDLVKDGALAQRTTANSIDSTLNTLVGQKNVGLVLLSSTTFSAQSSVQINSVFSSIYENYRFIITGNSSASSNLQARLVTGTTPNSGGSYNFTAVRSYNNTINGNNYANSNSFFNFGSLGAGREFQTTGDIIAPQVSDKTAAVHYSSFCFSGSEYQSNLGAGLFNAYTQFDGIQFYPSGGNITGTLRIYGYRNS